MDSTATGGNSNEDVRREPANALAKFGREAKPAAPALVETLSVTNGPAIRAAVSNAI